LTLVQAHGGDDEDVCMAKPKDPKVYNIGFGFSFSPYEYLNDDGELMGFGYDIIRAACRKAGKNCVFSVFYDYAYGLNSDGVSMALNNRWYDALANYLATPRRLASYRFCAAYADEPAAYMYVRRDSGIDNLNEIRRDSGGFGFRKGFRTNPGCLEKYLGISLASKSTEYDDTDALVRGLTDREVDVIFVDESDVRENMNLLKRVLDEKIKCASGGMSIMYRKDRADLSWFSEALGELRENKDYEWICNMYNGANKVECN